MTLVLPAAGDNNWDVPLNNVLTNLDGRVTVLEGFVNEVVSVPSTHTSTGSVGQIATNSQYLYVCVATNVWVRVALGSSW
jgi:hypothetical protein